MPITMEPLTVQPGLPYINEEVGPTMDLLCNVKIIPEILSAQLNRTLRFLTFRNHALASKTLAIRLKELQKGGILERQAYNEIPPRVEYKLTIKGQELVESLIDLLHWMRRWSSNSKAA
jgi:DNA-binding HxlR family transcriptional regulator